MNKGNALPPSPKTQPPLMFGPKFREGRSLDHLNLPVMLFARTPFDAFAPVAELPPSLLAASVRLLLVAACAASQRRCRMQCCWDITDLAGIRLLAGTRLHKCQKKKCSTSIRTAIPETYLAGNPCRHRRRPDASFQLQRESLLPLMIILQLPWERSYLHQQHIHRRRTHRRRRHTPRDCRHSRHHHRRHSRL